MKHIKRFNENISNIEPKIGDYVIISTEFFDTDDPQFFKEEIGKIKDIKYPNGFYSKLYGGIAVYTIKFNRYIQSLHSPYINVTKEEIYKFSERKEELEAIIDSEKYNL